MRTEITPFKLARYQEILKGQVRPIHWDVDPSSACDHRCRGCPYIFDGPIDPMLGVVRPESAPDKRTMLEYGRFSAFVTEAAERGARAVTFVGGGEPTLHPRFPEMMRRVHDAGLKFGVVTHFGRKYDEDFFRVAALATWIRVSVNAGTRGTYLRHQGKDDFDRAIENAARLAPLGPRVGMSFLVTNDNFLEIQLAARVAKVRGLAYVQFKPIVEVALGQAYAGHYEGRRVGEVVVEQLARAAKEADSSFQVIDQWSGRLDELGRHVRGEFSGRCWVPRFNPKLGANGVVYTCCELAYSDEGAIGSIYDEPLVTILDRAGEALMEMSRCPHCWDKPLNQAINEGRAGELVPPPESVDQEFV